MDPREFYNATTLRVLGQFQVLEYALKHYIGFSYHLIHSRLDGAIPFSYTVKDVENHPLNRLLTIFAKLNDNTDLHDRLNLLRSRRDHVAHRSLLVSMGKSPDEVALRNANSEFMELEDELGDCVYLVVKELRDAKARISAAAP